MSNYIRFKSDDFKIKVPTTVEDVNEYILNIVNNINPEANYIINNCGKDWIELISYNDPQDIITLTKY